MNTDLTQKPGKEPPRDDLSVMRSFALFGCRRNFDGLAWSPDMTDSEGSGYPCVRRGEHNRFMKKNGSLL